MHSVLWLILAFFNAAGLMLLVGAEFIAMLLVIVYVGAVAVLFLFVVMMLDIDFASCASGFTRNLPFGLLVALVLLAEIVIAVSAWQGRAVARAAPRPRPTRPSPTSRRSASCSTRRFLFLFEIAGLILLVAMIGAIVLTHRSRGDARGQNVSRQIAPRPEATRSRTCSRASGEGVEAVIGLAHYLTVAAILFVIGVLGIFLNRRTSS